MHGKIHHSQLDTAVYRTMHMQLVHSDQMAFNKLLEFSHQTKYILQSTTFFSKTKVAIVNQFVDFYSQVKPNLDSRIEPSDSNAGNSPTGFFGIQTSSFSSSSDVNGIKKHKEGASTTINDNGKVSSFTLEN